MFSLHVDCSIPVFIVIYNCCVKNDPYGFIRQPMLKTSSFYIVIFKIFFRLMCAEGWSFQNLLEYTAYIIIELLTNLWYRLTYRTEVQINLYSLSSEDISLLLLGPTNKQTQQNDNTVNGNTYFWREGSKFD